MKRVNRLAKHFLPAATLLLMTASARGEVAAQSPVLSADARWVGVLLIIIIGGFFLPAAVIGPLLRALAPRDLPPASSHDEPPGRSGHHGASGLRDDSAPENESIPAR